MTAMFRDGHQNGHLLRAAMLAVALLILLLPGLARALDIREVTSPGGITGWLVEDNSNPILNLKFAFDRGESAEPVGKEGLARLLAATLDEGAGDLDSAAFQKALADDSITISFDSGMDRFRGSFVTLTETCERAVELLRLAVNEARFDAEPVERMKASIQASLRRSLTNPRSKTSRAWWAGNFPDHPYGRSHEGTPESVAALTPEDLRAFRGDIMTREGLLAVAVGDIDEAAFGALLDTVFGALPERVDALEIPEAKPALAGETMVIDEDVPQSIVAFGQHGIGREDPDWYAASILNEVLAGGFGSRLTEEIREKRGLAYGVYAYLLPLDHAPLIRGGLATQNARVAESVALVRQEWRRMAEDGPTEQEVSDARAHLLGTFALGLADSGGVANIMLSMRDSDLPIDYLEQRDALYEAVTMDDLKRVAARLYDADALSVVVVGRPEGIEATVPAPGG